MDEWVLCEVRERVCTLVLNRPDKRNALNTAMFQQLDQHLAELARAAPDIDCVVLRGAGSSFCAGADLAALQAGVVVPSPMYKAQVIERLSQLPQPLIVAVHGYCYTGGLELALAGDFILADPSAQFADTHGRWGLVAAWGMTQRLPRRIGLPAAKRMMMTGQVVDAAHALALGLVDDYGPLDTLLNAWVDALLKNSAHTNRGVKQLLRETEGLPLSNGLAHEFFRNPGPAPDVHRRLAAFGAP